MNKRERERRKEKTRKSIQFCFTIRLVSDELIDSIFVVRDFYSISLSNKPEMKSYLNI